MRSTGPHGVCAERTDGPPRFRRVNAPIDADLTRQVRTLARCTRGPLDRLGLPEREAENSRPTSDGPETRTMVQ